MKKIFCATLICWLTTTAHSFTATEISKTTESWNGSLLPATNLEQPQMTVQRIKIEPGEKLPVHLHPVISCGVLVAGKLNIYNEYGTEVLNLVANSANNTVIEVVDKYHYGANEGDETAEIIVFYLSEKDQIITKCKKQDTIL